MSENLVVEQCPNGKKIDMIFTSIFFVLILGAYSYIFISNAILSNNYDKLSIRSNSLEAQLLVQNTSINNMLTNMASNRKYYDDFMKGIANDYKDGMKELRADVKAILKSLPRCDTPN